MADIAFFLSLVICIAIIVVGAKLLPVRIYSYALLGVVALTTINAYIFSELEIKLLGESPLHSGLLSLAQYGAVTLASKLWFSINYPKLSGSARITFMVLVYSSLISVVTASYWLSSSNPAFSFLLYPLAGISISLIGETIALAIIKK